MEKQVNWEAGRRASPNVLVGSDRRNLKICFGTEIFCGRRSTVRVWWTFPVTLVSILGHDAKKISLLSPGTANKSINCSHQPSLWKTVLLSCTSYNLDALSPPPPPVLSFQREYCHFSVQSGEHVCIKHLLCVKHANHAKCVRPPQLSRCS